MQVIEWLVWSMCSIFGIILLFAKINDRKSESTIRVWGMLLLLMCIVSLALPWTKLWLLVYGVSVCGVLASLIVYVVIYPEKR